MPYADPEKRRESDKARYWRDREKIIVQQAEWRRKNKERTAALNKAYRAKHRDRLIAADRAYALAHKEERKKKNKAYREANKEELRLYLKEYREKNKEELKAKAIDRMRKNPDIRRAIYHRRRAAEISAHGRMTASDLKKIQTILGKICLRCGASDDITIDHIIPLAAGGANGPTNLQPLCRKCNASKGARARTDHRSKKQIKLINNEFQLKMFEAING